MNLNIHEKPPVENNNEPVVELVISDLRERSFFGLSKYGTFLQSFNGRNALIDAYQEVLDLTMYTRQMIAEIGLYIEITNAVVEFFEAGNVEHLREKYEEYLSRRGMK